MLKPALQHFQLWVEVWDPHDPLRTRLISILRNKPDQFAFLKMRAMSSRKLKQPGINLGHRRRVVIRDVHRDLRPTIGEHAERLDAMQAPIRSTNVSGNRPGRRYVRLMEMNVIRNQEAASTNRRSPRGLMQLRPANIWPPRNILADSVAQSLKLASTNILKLNPVRPRSSRAVEIHWNSVPPPDKQTSLPRQHSAVSQRSSADRNKRNHVSSADSRMNPTLLGKVDQLSGLAGSANCRLNDCIRRTRNRHNRPIVCRVERPVEQTHSVQPHGRN